MRILLIRQRAAIAVAISLLTRIPCPSAWFVEDDVSALSPLWYGFVGVLLGGLLTLLAVMLVGATHVAGGICAFMLLCGWVWLTGALHLDGLADSVDAAAAAHKKPQEILRIFKDPQVGAFGVVALVLVLLGKYVLLSQMLVEARETTSNLAELVLKLGMPLLLALWLSRTFAVGYMRSSNYVGGGLGQNLIDRRYDIAMLSQGALTVLLIIVLLGFVKAMVLLLCLLTVTWYWRGHWQRLIQGYTGDCIGGLIELLELAALAVLLMLG